MEAKGKIHLIFDEQLITEKFKKREFILVIAENPEYPEVVKFEFIQDKCSILDGLSVGEGVTVQFNLKGREWADKNGEVKYFNTLQAWKLEKDNNAPTNMPSSGGYAAGEQPENETSDLPF